MSKVVGVAINTAKPNLMMGNVTTEVLFHCTKAHHKRLRYTDHRTVPVDTKKFEGIASNYKQGSPAIFITNNYG